MNEQRMPVLSVSDGQSAIAHLWSEHGGCRVMLASFIGWEVLMFLRMSNIRRISADIEAAENIKLFDSLLPDYAWVSETKKIDFLLWSID